MTPAGSLLQATEPRATAPFSQFCASSTHLCPSSKRALLITLAVRTFGTGETTPWDPLPTEQIKTSPGSSRESLGGETSKYYIYNFYSQHTKTKNIATETKHGQIMANANVQ